VRLKCSTDSELYLKYNNFAYFCLISEIIPNNLAGNKILGLMVTIGGVL